MRERGIVRDGLLRVLRKVSAGEYRGRMRGMKGLDVSRRRVQYIMIIVGFITRYRGLLSPVTRHGERDENVENK